MRNNGFNVESFIMFGQVSDFFFCLLPKLFASVPEKIRIYILMLFIDTVQESSCCMCV